MGTRRHLRLRTERHYTSKRCTGASSQHGQVRCGRSGRQAATTIGPLDPLAAERTAGWFLQDANCSKRLWAGCQSRGRLLRKSAEAHDVMRSSQCLRLPTEIQWRSESYNAFHQSPMLSDSENQCMWSKCLRQRWTLPKFGSAGRPVKVSRFRPRLGAVSARRLSTTWVLTSW